MDLIINGEAKSVNDNYTIEDILKELKIEDKVMAVAVNMQIVKRENWGKFNPTDGDKIEFLHFVGGG